MEGVAIGKVYRTMQGHRAVVKSSVMKDGKSYWVVTHYVGATNLNKSDTLEVWHEFDGSNPGAPSYALLKPWESPDPEYKYRDLLSGRLKSMNLALAFHNPQMLDHKFQSLHVLTHEGFEELCQKVVTAGVFKTTEEAASHSDVEGLEWLRDHKFLYEFFFGREHLATPIHDFLA